MTTLTGAPSCGPVYQVGKGQWTTHTGFPVTTGTVQVQQTTGSAGGDIFTIVGSDMRTALGAGMITLVAGGLTHLETIAGHES
jgi:hypothetical protein